MVKETNKEVLQYMDQHKKIFLKVIQNKKQEGYLRDKLGRDEMFRLSSSSMESWKRGKRKEKKIFIQRNFGKS